MGSTSVNQSELESLLRNLSEASFRSRLPVVVYLGSVSIVGMLGNTLVAIVFGIHFPSCATRTFVLFLATLDLTANCVAIPLQVYTIRHAYDADMVSCRCLFGFSTLTTQASGSVLVLVSLDRFWRICVPLQLQLTSREAFIWSSFLVLGMFSIFGAFIPSYGIHQLYVASADLRVRMCWSADVYKDTYFSKLYQGVVVIVFTVGFSTMTFCYVSIGRIFWQKKYARKGSAQKATSKEVSNRLDTSENAGRLRAVTLWSEHIRSTVNPGLQVEEEDMTVKDEIDSRGHMTTTVLWNATLVSTSTHRLPVDESPAQPDDQPKTKRTWLPLPESARPFCDQPLKEESHTSEESQSESGAEAAKSQLKRTGAVKVKDEARQSLRIQSQVCQFVLHIRSHTTLMMCVLTVLYLISWLPHLVVRVACDEPVNMCERFVDCGYNLYAIALRSYYLHSAVGPFVYSFCNDRFRQESRKLIRTVIYKVSGKR